MRVLFELTGTVFQLFVFTMFFQSMLEGWRFNNKLLNYGSIAVVFVGRTVVPFILDFYHAPSASNITAVFTIITTAALVYFLYQGKVGTKAALVALYMFIGMGAEIVAVSVLKAITGLDITAITAGIPYYMAQAIVFVVVFLFMKLAIMFKISKGRKIDPIHSSLLFLVPFISVMCIYYLYISYDRMKDLLSTIKDLDIDTSIIEALTAKSNSSNWSIVLIISGLMYVNILIFFLFDKTLDRYELAEKARLLNKHIEHQSSSYEKASASFMNMRSLIHDTNKHMLYIKECAKSGDTAEISAYVNLVLDKMETSYLKVSSGNPVVDALVNNTLDVANEHKIATNLNISYLGKDLPVDRFDLCIILGNVLDNAVDACKAISHSSNNYFDRFIDISIFKNETAVVINVKNSCITEPKRGITGRFETTKLSGSSKNPHGVGLYNIETTVEKYDGSVTTDAKNQTFSITCILPI
jgi:hypothetical protein